MQKFFILIVAVAFIAACSQNNKEPGDGKSASATVSAPASPEPVIQPVEAIPENVLALYSGVVIEVTNKLTGEEYSAEIPFNQATAIVGTTITIEVTQFLPDFMMSEEGYATRSLDLNNVAARVRITGTSPEFDGVLFMQYPDVHPYEGNEYAVFLTNVINK